MRLIDADALIEETECLFKDHNSTEDYMGIGYNHGVGDSIAIIKNLPTIEAEPVKRGKWIEEPNCWYRCSVCGQHYPSTRGYMYFNYCPNCGARMSEGSEGC